MLGKVIASVLGAGLMFSAAPAFAGEWKVNPRACPDLREDRYDRREDRRDARVDYGRQDRREDRYDRRENRRDAAVTVCPASAFYYAPSRGERQRAFHHRNARPPLKWDKRMHMRYTYVNGRKIYVRG